MNIAGANDSIYTIYDAQSGDAASYSVVVSNGLNSVVSNAAALTVNPAAPSIYYQPPGQTIYYHQNVTLTLGVSGTKPMTFQWRKDGNNIPGATNGYYSFPDVGASDAGSYSVVVTNSIGSATSNVAAILVKPWPIRLALQYWGPDDGPDRWVQTGQHMEYTEEWHDGGCEPHYDCDEDGNWYENGEDCYDGYYETVGHWVPDYVFLPDGYGSRWWTTSGTFHILGDSSNVDAGNFRGYLWPKIETYSNLTFRAWASAQSGNCSSFTGKLYNPSGALVASQVFTPDNYWQCTAALSDSGMWRVELSYTNATEAADGVVSYYIYRGNGNWPAVPQTITFPPIVNHVNGETVFANAVSSSGLPVSLSVTAGRARPIGNSITMQGAGSTTIRASQPGGTFNGITVQPAANVERTFQVSAGPQTISFPAINDHVFGDAPFSIAYPTSSSGLPVAVAAQGPVFLSGGTITLSGAGTATLTAFQAGNGDYLPASVVRTFNIAKASQTVTFGALASRTYGEPPFTISASASSGLPVVFSVVSGPAVVLGQTVTLTGTGSVQLTASQPGNDSYNAASASQTFTVGADTIAPSQPGPITFSEKSATTVRLTWSASTDNVAVASYEISGAGPTRTVVGSSVKLSGLTANTTYQISVRAKDGAGNFSTARTDSVTMLAESGTVATDSDGDGVPDRVENLLGTNPNVVGTADNSDQLQLRVKKPAQ